MSQSTASSTQIAASPQRHGCSTEFDLLCACAAVPLPPDRLAQIGTMIEKGVDWQEFLRLADHHGMSPLVAANLKAVGGVPPEVAQSLRSSFAINVRRALWFESEMLRIASHFETQGIKAVPYKGPLLAEHAYGDVALRNFGDLDFLIAPTDFEHAKLALTGLGYRPSEEQARPLESFWLRYGYERSFDSDAGRYLVELQWGVFPHFFAVNLQVEDLLERSRCSSAGGKPVWDLSPEDAFLVLCLHAAKHLWMRLIWLCDISQIIRTKKIDFALVLLRAQSLGVMRLVAVSLWLIDRLLGAEIPSEAQPCIDGDSQVRLLGEALAARLSRSAVYDFESTEYFRWILKLRERHSDQWRYLWRLLWTPSVGDIRTVNLPRSLFPLYRAIRVARLARRFLLPAHASAGALAPH